LHDRCFSAASSFQIGVSRGRRIASSGMLARVSQGLYAKQFRDDPQDSSEALIKNFPFELRAQLASTFTLN
jgi:hypothetical protein